MKPRAADARKKPEPFQQSLLETANKQMQIGRRKRPLQILCRPRRGNGIFSIGFRTLLAIGICVAVACPVLGQPPGEAVKTLRIDTYRSNYITQSTKDLLRENQDGRLKLQVSIKTTLVTFRRFDLWMSYTMLAFWELFDESSPFKEYNHNPEAYLLWRKQLPLHLQKIKFGWAHESNGLVAGPENRSWDRIFIEPNFVWRRSDSGLFDGYRIYPRFWLVFDDAEENRNIEDESNFFGSSIGGALTLVATRGDVSRVALVLGVKSRMVEFHINPLPGSSNFSTFIQAFNGKGEGLIDFNRDTTSLSLGIALLMNPTGD